MANSLDVLFAAPVRSPRLEICLTALARELENNPTEATDITLTVAHAGNLPARLAKNFPRIVWIECDTRATAPELWSKAINTTCGESLAILDTECAVAEGWLNDARNAIATAPKLLGGAVEPRGLTSRAAWAAYFCVYGAFMLPLADGTAHELPGNNLVLRREVLGLAPEYVTPRFWKAYFVRALNAQNIFGVNAPALVVYYEKNYPARAWLARRVLHARCFAAMRVRRASFFARACFGLLAPALPLLLIARLARTVFQKRRHRREFLTALPWIFAGLSAWAYGEWLGYWFGADKSCEEIF